MLHFFLSISRQLPNFKGKFRLMRFLLQSQLKSVSNIIVHAANGVLYKIPNINEINPVIKEITFIILKIIIIFI